jgi:D-alanine-D-alanine ligase
MTYDLKTEYVFKSDDPPDANAEFDNPRTIEVIQEAIEALGHRVIRIGDVERLLKQWDRIDVDLVFNIAEGRTGRNREAQVPLLLELKGIPYTGSDALTLALTLDKWMAKKVFLAEGIPTPRFFQMAQPDAALPQDIAFPLIVKPRYEGSSKGLSECSVVHSVEALRDQAAWVIRTYRQPALVEEFIRGEEFTVAIIGNECPEVFPPVRVRFDGQGEEKDRFYTFDRIAQGVQYVCPAGIPYRLEEELKGLALSTYRAVECLDFGRVDFRVDEQGRPYVLEINPLPSLSTEDVFGTLANHCGWSYSTMIAKILDAAIRRYDLKVGASLKELLP